jgi:hypothetical protein
LPLRFKPSSAGAYPEHSHDSRMPLTPFVPPQFQVPRVLETAEFRLRMLTVNDVVKDYDAVMTSLEH